ncbi:peptidoglycan DD-metalloendopeptidase family protein [Methylophilaceae bacterium]|nr:peptidoglycan DD-metalloendopeptidase family protein [Methylophilaceae bacterium]
MPKKISFLSCSVLVIFICVIAYTSNAYPNESIDSTQNDLENIQQKINSLDKQIIQKTKAQKGITRELKQEEKNISKTKKEIYKIKKRARNNKKRLEALKKELTELEKNIEDKRNNLSLNYYHSYTHGKFSSLQMLLEGINPNEISRDQRYLGFLSKAQSDSIKDIKKDLIKVEENKKSIGATIKKIASLKKAKEKKAKALQKEKVRKKKTLKKINLEIKSKKKIKSKLIADEKKLTSIISTLIQKSQAENEKRIKQKKIVADNQSLPDSSLDKLNFRKLKKKLKLPVKGKIIHKFGKKRRDTGIKWKGIFIKANEGDPVYAVAKGKVVFSDWLRGFGNILIIDHGGNYMSLYGNNESLLMKQNSMVNGGDQIATVGNSGGNSANGLYYELRKNSKPFNPMSWTTLK